MTEKNTPDTLAGLFQALRDREAALLDAHGVADLLVELKRHCRTLETNINGARASLSAKYSEVPGTVLGGGGAIVGVALGIVPSPYMHAAPPAFSFEMRVGRDGVRVTAGSETCLLAPGEVALERLEALLVNEIWRRLPGVDA